MKSFNFRNRNSRVSDDDVDYYYYYYYFEVYPPKVPNFVNVLTVFGDETCVWFNACYAKTHTGLKPTIGSSSKLKYST
jgi:hypothetical protein